MSGIPEMGQAIVYVCPPGALVGVVDDQFADVSSLMAALSTWFKSWERVFWS